MAYDNTRKPKKMGMTICHTNEFVQSRFLDGVHISYCPVYMSSSRLSFLADLVLVWSSRRSVPLFLLRVGWRNLVQDSLIFAIIVSFM